MSGSHALLAVLVLVNLGYLGRWIFIERARAQVLETGSAVRVRPDIAHLATGFVTNFLDTLGIGSFALATAVFKFRKSVADENIPGTLNAGQALPTATEGLIFIALVTVDLRTLVSMIAAAVAGAWLGARIVSRLSRQAVRITMGLALLVAAAIFAASSAHWLPGGGESLKLSGPVLLFACGVNFALGALMSAGVGLYAPCLILLCLLGMNPIAAFPVMMGSCALLMPIASIEFVRSGRYDLSAALGLAVGGIPGVLLAAFVVRSLPLDWLRWLVVIVVVYASGMMLRSALTRATRVIEPVTEPRG
jgi:uncharacterized membrane protein YfcA